MFSDVLSEQYVQYGSWVFLCNNDCFIFQLLCIFEWDNDDCLLLGYVMKLDFVLDGLLLDGFFDGLCLRLEMLFYGWCIMFWVVDQLGCVLVGLCECVLEDGIQCSIVVNGVEVGKVIVLLVEWLMCNIDINFDWQ